MASSRWKRFAFFERQTLNITDVLEDLLDGEHSNNNKSLRSLVAAATTSASTLSFVTTTASLPAHLLTGTTTTTEPLVSSLQACFADTTLTDTTTVPLPPANASTTTTTTDDSGSLVLAFIASQDSPRIHCIDITRRCHALVEDAADGWRGYLTTTTSNGIVDLAVCHGSSTQHGSYSPILLACVHERVVSVYQDPHVAGLSAQKPPDTSPTQDLLHFTVDEGLHPTAVALTPSVVGVGTAEGVVLLYRIQASSSAVPWVRIPPPPSAVSAVVSLQWSSSSPQQHLFVAYAEGLCCYDLPASTSSSSSSNWAAPTGRHDLDGRSVTSASLVDGQDPNQVAVVRVVWSQRMCP